MIAPPLIGLPGRRRKGRELAGLPAPLVDFDLDVYFADYSRAVVAAGGLPVHLPLDIDPVAVVDRLDGVMLTGGSDIEPARYGARAEPHTEVEPERDELEIVLCRRALEVGLPILGICRGIQVLNVTTGGSLHQHVPVHTHFDKPADTLTHDVDLVAGSVARAVYGDRISVNSLHHQAVDRVGEGLEVTGRADDGGIEAIEMPGRPVLAVQWHPEMLDVHDPVFGWLVDAARSTPTGRRNTRP